MRGQKRDAEGKLRKRIFARSELPELEHAFMEGIELSISDLAAFIPIYKYLQRIYNNSETQNNDMSDHDRAKINWYFRMIKIKRLQEVIESLAWSKLFVDKNKLDKTLESWKEHEDIIELLP